MRMSLSTTQTSHRVAARAAIGPSPPSSAPTCALRMKRRPRTTAQGASSHGMRTSAPTPGSCREPPPGWAGMIPIRTLQHPVANERRSQRCQGGPRAAMPHTCRHHHASSGRISRCRRQRLPSLRQGCGLRVRSSRACAVSHVSHYSRFPATVRWIFRRAEAKCRLGMVLRCVQVGFHWLRHRQTILRVRGLDTKTWGTGSNTNGNTNDSGGTRDLGEIDLARLGRDCDLAFFCFIGSADRLDATVSRDRW
jgi:hypothetical protein